jgi:Anti-sigma-K factor rskA/Putative zinc-finger
VNELHDLVAPYALDALDSAERAEFEAHLVACPRCLEELAELSEATVDLAAEFAIAPPEELKARIIAAVDTSSPSTKVTRLEPRRRVGWMIPAAAAVIAIVFAGLWAFTNAQLDEANLVAAVYEAPDATVVQIQTNEGPARFTYSPSLSRGVFNGSELSDLADSDVYQLWLIDQAGPRSAGTLQPGDPDVLVEAVSPGLTLAMTVEPEPGGDVPSTEPLFAADL